MYGDTMQVCWGTWIRNRDFNLPVGMLMVYLWMVFTVKMKATFNNSPREALTIHFHLKLCRYLLINK